MCKIDHLGKNVFPTYQEILSGTHDLAYFVKLNEVFIQDKGMLAGELALRWNQIYPSLINAFEKLKRLGYVYTNNEVSILNIDIVNLTNYYE